MIISFFKKLLFTEKKRVIEFIDPSSPTNVSYLTEYEFNTEFL